jgi:hypothetical protein
VKPPKSRPQLLAAQEYTCNSFGQRNLPGNFPYLHENEEFQGEGEGGYLCCNMLSQKGKGTLFGAPLVESDSA